MHFDEEMEASNLGILEVQFFYHQTKGPHSARFDSIVFLARVAFRLNWTGRRWVRS